MSPTFTVMGNSSNAVKGVCNVMGTFVTIIAVDPDQEYAKKAVRSAFNEIYRINDLMSVHKTDSEVSELNKNGFHESLSQDTKYVIEKAIYFSELTDGIFDITLLPVLKIWERHTHNKTIPEKSELDRNLDLVDYRNIIIKDNSIKFRKDGMNITLAGVAKGYAVDRAIDILRQKEIGHALVNGGGDIRVVNGKTDESPWKIGLIDPLNRKRFFTTVDLYNQAVATSGPYQRSFNDLLNPREGRPNQEILSSTIISEKAIDADVLATAFFISGHRKGEKFLQKFGNAQSISVTNEGRVMRY